MLAQASERVEAHGAPEPAPLLVRADADRLELAHALTLVEPGEGVCSDTAVGIDHDAVELGAPRRLAPHRLVDLVGEADGANADRWQATRDSKSWYSAIVASR